MHDQKTRNKISAILTDKWAEGRETHKRKYIWKVIYSDGKEETIPNVQKFCDLNGLSRQHFYKSQNFKTKNFTLVKVEIQHKDKEI